MKKGAWIAIIIAILVVTGAFIFIQKAEAPTVVGDETADVSIELLKKATFKVPDSDTAVSLVNGEASFELAPGSAAEGTVLLLDEMTAQWKKDGRTDVSTILAVNTGGTATFLYLVLFDIEGDTVTKKSEVFLGDRINITHIGVGELVHDSGADYRVTVQTVVRKDGEPFAATPSVQVTRTFYVTNQTLKEIEVGGDDT